MDNNATEHKLNYRILVIDDDEGVRDNFAAVLCPKKESTNAIDNLASDLFDEELDENHELKSVDFEVHFAVNGQRGIDKVREAKESGKPFAVIFCDMRMPGMDGLQCIEEIRKIDKVAQVIFVTAFSDHSITEIVNRAGADIAYFNKPFAHEELLQLATKSILDWNRAREFESLLKSLISLRGESEDMQRLLEHLLGELSKMLNTDSVGLFQFDEQNVNPKAVAGRLNDVRELNLLLSEFPAALDTDNEWIERAGHLIMPISNFGFAIALGSNSTLSPDKQYMVRLFLEQASLAIINSEFRMKLMESQKMSALGVAAGQILHDMRSPVGNARALLSMLKEENYQIFDKATLYQQINLLLDRALALAEDTMDFSKKNIQLSLQEIDIVAVLQTELKLWEQALTPKGVNIAIEVEPQGSSFTVDVDCVRILRVIDNLVRNACDAMAEQKSAKIILQIELKEQTVNISVSDNGPGIPDQIKAQLFKPFVTAGKAHGTGLGLSIAKTIVAAHQGEIDVTSSDKGTTFTISLPKTVQNTQADTTKPAEPVAKESLSGLNILVVDDEFINQQIALSQLELLGANVELAESASIAEEMLKQQSYDLLLVDVEMPVVNGVEFVKNLRAQEQYKSSPPIIAVTAHNKAKKEKELLQAGFNQMLSKPFDAKALLTMV